MSSRFFVFCFFFFNYLTALGPSCSSWDFQSWLQHLLLVFSRSVVSDSATPWTAAHQASLSFTVSWSLFKLTSIEMVMPSNHLILCHSFSSCLQSFPASGSFPMSQLFTPVGRTTGASSSASVLPMNIQVDFLWVDWLQHAGS